MILNDILKVLYSPVNAFKQIIQKPDIKGPIIILALVLIATVGRQYAVGSKIFIQTDSQEFVGLLTTDLVASFIGTSVINSAIDFFLVWILYTGVILVVAVALHEKIGSRRTLFIVLGHTFIVTAVSILISLVLISTFPAVNFPISSWPPATEAEALIVGNLMEEFWYPTIAFRLVFYISFIMDFWVAALCAVSIRFLGELTWRKAIMFAATAYVATFLLRGLLA